jgi:hypothetical protein
MNNYTVVVDNKSYVFNNEHMFFRELINCIAKGNASAFLEMIDCRTAIHTWSRRYFKVVDDIIYYKGNPVNKVINNYIFEIVKDGFDCEPLLKFVENLNKNPSADSVEQLFEFLKYKNLPITEDGCFLGYKAVTKEYKDKYSGKFCNKIGRIVKMPREKVVHDPNNECNAGLHVGTIEYVDGFANDEDIKLIVKVNPKNVVSVPNHDCRKLRCCEYKVVSLFSSPLSSSYEKIPEDSA